MTTTEQTPLLEADGLTKHFPGRGGLMGRGGAPIKAVDGVSFTVGAGQTLGIVGESGCGKSTTGRLLMRLLEPTSGTVRLNGRDIGAMKRAEAQEYRRQSRWCSRTPPRPSTPGRRSAPPSPPRCVPRASTRPAGSKRAYGN